MTGNRRTMHPRREARVHLKQPGLIGGVANHFEFAAAGPVQRLYHCAKRSQKIIGYRGYLARPSFSFGRHIALLHSNRAQELALVSA